MKRTGKQVLTDAVQLIFKDLKYNRIAFLAILLYFICTKLLFHTVCPMVFLTGIPCPACGLTRAGIALICGRFIQAWEIHPFIYVVLLLGIMWGIQRYILQKKYKWMRWIYILSLAALIIFYIIRMILFFPGNPPMSYYYNNMCSLIHQLFTYMNNM